MKFKHIISIFLACFCSFLCVGCNSGRNVTLPQINNSRYLSAQVESTYLSSGYSRTGNINLASFSTQQVDTTSVRAHKTLKFVGTSWIYKMYIEAVYFYFYCTKDIKLNDFKFTMVDLDGGNTEDSTLPEGTYKVEQVISLSAKAEKGYLVRVDIGHTALNEDFSIELSMANESAFDGECFWTIYGLAIYGETRI